MSSRGRHQAGFHGLFLQRDVHTRNNDTGLVVWDGKITRLRGQLGYRHVPTGLFIDTQLQHSALMGNAMGGAVIRTVECPAGFNPDSHNPPEACWRQDPCPVARVTPVPENDVCAQTLEAYNPTQAQKTAACGTLTTGMQTAVNCFADKLSRINNPTTGQPIPLRITADIRNLAYQAHFREIWDKMEDIVFEITRNPALQTACAARRAEIAAEKGCDNAGPCAPCSAPTATARRHCLASRPAPPNPNDATHVQGNAIDVDRGQTVDPLQSALNQRTPPQSIQGQLDAPTNCRLDYLGAQDPVHFQLRP